MQGGWAPEIGRHIKAKWKGGEKKDQYKETEGAGDGEKVCLRQQVTYREIFSG